MNGDASRILFGMDSLKEMPWRLWEWEIGWLVHSAGLDHQSKPPLYHWLSKRWVLKKSCRKLVPASFFYPGNWTAENHLFEKENHLNQTFMTLGSNVHFPGCTFQGNNSGNPSNRKVWKMVFFRITMGGWVMLVPPGWTFSFFLAKDSPLEAFNKHGRSIERLSIKSKISKWLIFKLLGIPYLVGKMQFLTLLFHGPKWLSKKTNSGKSG